MELITAAFVTGLAIGVVLGYQLCTWHNSREGTPFGRFADAVQERARPDLPVHGDERVEWQFKLTPRECEERNVPHNSWGSMSWCHPELLEHSHESHRSFVVELTEDGTTRWYVNCCEMQQRSVTSGRLRDVRRRELRRT